VKTTDWFQKLPKPSLFNLPALNVLAVVCSLFVCALYGTAYSCSMLAGQTSHCQQQHTIKVARLLQGRLTFTSSTGAASSAAAVVSSASAAGASSPSTAGFSGSTTVAGSADSTAKASLRWQQHGQQSSDCWPSRSAPIPSQVPELPQSRLVRECRPPAADVRLLLSSLPISKASAVAQQAALFGFSCCCVCNLCIQGWAAVPCAHLPSSAPSCLCQCHHASEPHNCSSATNHNGDLPM